MGFISRIGSWIDARFPEKLTPTQAKEQFQIEAQRAYDKAVSVHQRCEILEQAYAALRGEINRLKAEANFKRVRESTEPNYRQKFDGSKAWER